MSARIITWVDVKEELRRSYEADEWPSGVQSIEAYWTGLRLYVSVSAEEDRIRVWLRDVFGPQLIEGDDSTLSLRLESASLLPIEIEHIDDDGTRRPYVPTFSPPARIPGPRPSVGEDVEGEFHEPPIIVFHSYKGGVGRTTHALAFALDAVEYTEGKILLVDGDFEAPGLSWHVRDRYPDPKISYADLLILAHADEDRDAAGTVKLVANYLENQEDHGMYVLPSFREEFRWEALDIRPDHLTAGRSPYAVSRLLASLGRELGVGAIVVDLRAGLSELSAGLLLDPRVFRVFVTSVGEQSLRGIEALTKKLRVTLGPSAVGTTHFVVSHIPSVLLETELPGLARERLISSLEPADDQMSPGDQVLEEGEVIISEYDLSLVTLPLAWERTLSVIEKAGLPSRLRALVERSPLSGGSSGDSSPSTTSLDDARRLLAEQANKQIFAETGQTTGFLRIDPLTRLAHDHRTRLPVVVVTGARGAGKTYTFLQLLQARNWSSFVENATEPTSAMNHGAEPVRIVPLIEPRNFSQQTRDELERGTIGDPESQMSTWEVQNEIAKKLESGDRGLTAWREFWFDTMAWRIGHRPREEGAGRDLVDHLGSSDRRVIFVVDGLEDVFQGFADDEVQQVALRAILQDVPEQLDRGPGAGSVGIVVMVRPDLVRSAIVQNSQQFLARYRPYALRWSRDTALKLAIWLAVEAGALDVEGGSTAVAELSETQREELLVKLWGTKLGSARSKEARSKAWVIGVLSDFEGQIQARDVVRLVHHAARRSMDQDGRFDDRILDPRAMREALKDWGKEKISELGDEDARLKEIFERLASVQRAKKRVPFKADVIGIDREDIEYLRSRGIVYDDNGKIYITELVRIGLDFDMANGARPRIVLLRRKIMQSARG